MTAGRLWSVASAVWAVLACLSLVAGDRTLATVQTGFGMICLRFAQGSTR